MHSFAAVFAAGCEVDNIAQVKTGQIPSSRTFVASLSLSAFACLPLFRANGGHVGKHHPSHVPDLGAASNPQFVLLRNYISKPNDQLLTCSASRQLELTKATSLRDLQSAPRSPHAKNQCLRQIPCAKWHQVFHGTPLVLAPSSQSVLWAP